MRPSYSIIIPALNESAIVAAAVAGALALGGREVIVADGGSSDETASRAEAAGAKVVVAARGRAHQQNTAARLATGDFLLFLHADTRLVSDGLRQIDAACRDGMVHCGAFRQVIEAKGMGYRLLERGNAWRARHRGLPYGDQGIFVERELFFKVGGFPSLMLMEDLFLMRRLRRVSWPALLKGPIYVSARRWQHRGIVGQTLRNWSLLAAARCGVHPDRLARYYG